MAAIRKGKGVAALLRTTLAQTVLLATLLGGSSVPAAGSSVIYDTTMGVSVDANGFTDLTLRPTVAVTYYVKNSGSDANGGTNPTAPLATVAHAISLVAAGNGDHVLLAEGSTFPEALPWLAFKGGFSATYPTVISSYDPADPTNSAKIGMGHQRSARPAMTAAPAQISGGPFSFVAIKGIDLNPGNNANQGIGIVGDGTGFTGGASYFLFENNLLRYSSLSIDSAIAQTSAPNSHHVIIRNNSIFGAWADDASIHIGGIYIAGTDGVTIEDNFVWHTGWRIGAGRDDNPSSAAHGGAGIGGGPTVFNHPVYLQTNTAGANVRRNLFVDNAADAGIARGDTTVWTANVSLRNPAGTGLGGGPDYNTERPNGVSFEASYNLSVAAIDLNSTNPSGYGYTTSNGKPGSRVHHNLLIYSTVAAGVNAIAYSNSASFNQPSYMEHELNLSFHWNGSTCYYSAGGIFPSQALPFTTYDNLAWDCSASGTNVASTSLTFPNPYTEAALYVAAGYADLNAITADMSLNPEKQVQRSLRSLAFTGYGRSAFQTDAVAPTLSAPSGSSPSAGNATIGITTDDATGRLYYVLTTSSTPPHVSQIKMGVTAAHTAAAAAGSLAVTSSGAKSFNLSSVAPGTYYAHFVHEDAEANKSLAVSTSSFTVASASVTWAANADYTITNAGSTAQRTAAGTFWGYELTSAAKTNGTADFTIDAMGSAANNYVGINDGLESSNSPGSSDSMFWRQDGALLYAGSTIATLATWTTADKLRIVKAAGNYTFYKWNGSSWVQQGSVIDSTAAGYGLGSVLAGACYPSIASLHNTGLQVTADFSAF